MSDEKIFFDAGKRIRELRGTRTQSEFAQELGVNRKTVERWEAGERLPDGQSLLALMRVFEADVNFILTGITTEAQARLIELRQHIEIAGKDTDDLEKIKRRLARSIGSSQVALPPRQRALLANYEATDDAGKKIIEGTASLAAQPKAAKGSRK